MVAILPVLESHNELPNLFCGEGFFQTQESLLNLVGGAVDLFSHIMKNRNFFRPFVFLLSNLRSSFKKEFALLF